MSAIGVQVVKQKNQRSCEMVTCCGKTFPAGFKKRHEKGVLHSKRIRVLLESDCLRFYEIGERLGVSRERVRQVAEHFGMDAGLTRRTSCALKQRETKSPARNNPRFMAFTKACERHGLHWQLVEVNNASFASSFIIVNDSLVALRSAKSFKTKRGRCFHLAPCKARRKVRFIAYLFNGLDRWLVVPIGSAPQRNTTCNPFGRDYKSNQRQQWKAHLDAFHLLKRENGAAR